MKTGELGGVKIVLSPQGYAKVQKQKMIEESEILKEMQDRLEKTEECRDELFEVNKVLRKNAEHNDHVVDSMRWTVRTLEGRIKKAVEHLEIKQARYRNEEDYKIEDKDLFDIEKILIGDDKE